jgi:hypothetical protein
MVRGGRRVAVALIAGLAAAPSAYADWTTTGAYTGIKHAWRSGDLGGLMWNEPLIYKGLVIVANKNDDV